MAGQTSNTRRAAPRKGTKRKTNKRKTNTVSQQQRNQQQYPFGYAPAYQQAYQQPMNQQGNTMNNMGQVLLPSAAGAFLMNQSWNAVTGGQVKKRHLPLLALFGLGYAGYKTTKFVGRAAVRGVRKINPVGRTKELIQRQKLKSQQADPYFHDESKPYDNEETVTVEITFAQRLRQHIEDTQGAASHMELIQGGNVCGVQLAGQEPLLCGEREIKDQSGKNYLQAGQSMMDTLTPLLNRYKRRDEKTLIAVTEFYFNEGLLEV